MEEKITLYIGLFDKDTKKQEVDTKQAFNIVNNIVNNIVLQYTEGATIYMGDGIYKHIDKTTVIEKNIIVILYDVTRETLNKILKEVKTALNQEAVLVEKTQVVTSFE